MGLRLDKVVPWGRSLQEYIHMFDLTDDDLQRKILDGYSVEIRQVPYEFQKGGNQLLRVIGVG